MPPAANAPARLQSFRTTFRTASDNSSSRWFAAEDIRQALGIRPADMATRIKRAAPSHRAHRRFQLRSASTEGQSSMLQLLQALTPKAACTLARRSRSPQAKAVAAHILALTLKHHHHQATSPEGHDHR